MMKMTVEEIKTLCIKYCAICGVNFDSPVTIGDKLGRTLGCCRYITKGEVVTPTEIRISKILLEEGSLENIHDVIKHECAHYVVMAITHKAHGHDTVFKEYCAKIGTNFNKPKSKINVTPEKFYRYTVYCPKCGTLLGGYHRNTAKVVKNPENFISNCCQEKPVIKINW